MTDRYTDELFDLGDLAAQLVFPVSRLLVDPERFRNDKDESMAVKGMGAIYTLTHDGNPLKQVNDREELLREYYDPHHEALGDVVKASLAEHGRCLIIDCHSFPSQPIPCDMDQLRNRPDICLGTSGIHSPNELVNFTREAFERQGLSILIDRPYSGSIVPLEFYDKDPRVTSLMVEINRKLCMDEATGDRLLEFNAVQRQVCECLKQLISHWEQLP